jgi:hypothetical protein
MPRSSGEIPGAQVTSVHESADWMITVRAVGAQTTLVLLHVFRS